MEDINEGLREKYKEMLEDDENEEETDEYPEGNNAEPNKRRRIGAEDDLSQMTEKTPTVSEDQNTPTDDSSTIASSKSPSESSSKATSSSSSSSSRSSSSGSSSSASTNDSSSSTSSNTTGKSKRGRKKRGDGENNRELCVMEPLYLDYL